jgi:hypothetical protein
MTRRASHGTIDFGEESLEITNRQDRAQRRRWLRCAYCAPNRGENSKRHAPHGTRKPKRKDHRIGVLA